MNKLVIGIFVLLVVIGGFLFYNVMFQSDNSDMVFLDSSLDAGGFSGISDEDNEEITSTLTETNPKTYTLDIKSFAFQTPELAIKAGDAVTWTNLDSTAHTVTSDSGSELDSKSLS
ncbi:MAG: plastocyanin/azurin family copper-binding protein, partial [Nanoarchaeota archaeon]